MTNIYITYEEPYQGRTFTEEQMYREIYSPSVDHNEYPDFECWLIDMVRSGVFEITNQVTINRKDLIELVLDMEITSKELIDLKTEWKAFYENPLEFRNCKQIIADYIICNR